MRIPGRRPLVGVALAGAVLLAAVGCAADTESGGTDEVKIDLTSAPMDLSWESFNGVRIPRSLTDGPKDYDAVPSGYSNTPQGAVLAAVRGQAYLALTPDQQWGRMVSVVTAPGPGRDEFAANRALVSVTGSVPADRATKFVAFRVTSYQAGDAPTAAVDVVQEVGSPAERFAYPVALQWIGDWRLVLPTSAENVDARPLDNLDGYTRLEES